MLRRYGATDIFQAEAEDEEDDVEDDEEEGNPEKMECEKHGPDNPANGAKKISGASLVSRRNVFLYYLN